MPKATQPEQRKAPQPMSHKHAVFLLNPLRHLLLSPKKLVQRLNLHADAEVLEIGPGPGFFSAAVARSIPEGTLTLLDIQQEMLDMAKKRLDRMGISNAAFIKADAARMPFGDASYDAVFLVSVLGEMPDPAQCLKEAHRILRPNGLLSVSEQPGDPHFVPMAELTDLAARIGFKLERTFGPRFNYTLNFRKTAGE
jgi:Methylase involved in ubiquinone/menaquinone biosynthesis